MARTRDTDYIQQLASYIKRNLSKGYTQEALKWALVDQGHSRTEIERAVKLANEQLAMSAPKMIEKPVIKYETEPPVDEKKGFWARVKSWFS
jgi:hypothetical protein